MIIKKLFQFWYEGKDCLDVGMRVNRVCPHLSHDTLNDFSPTSGVSLCHSFNPEQLRKVAVSLGKPWFAKVSGRQESVLNMP
jgi:hypothetical protein